MATQRTRDGDPRKCPRAAASELRSDDHAVYEAIGRRERDGEFSGNLVAYFLAANDDDAHRKATEAFLLGSTRATIENRELHVEATGESPQRLLAGGREHVHFVETRRPDGGPDREWNRNLP